MDIVKLAYIAAVVVRRRIVIIHRHNKRRLRNRTLRDLVFRRSLP